MSDPRPKHTDEPSPYQPSNSSGTSEQHKLDEIVRDVTQAFSRELSTIMHRGRHRT